MYVPITTFNISYPVERPWKRLPIYYSTIPAECKRENKVFLRKKSPCSFLQRDFEVTLRRSGYAQWMNTGPRGLVMGLT